MIATLLLLLALPAPAASIEKDFPAYKAKRFVGSCPGVSCEDWAFKSRKAVTKDASGSTFIRFYVFKTVYGSPEKATAAWNETKAETVDADPPPKDYRYSRLDGPVLRGASGPCLFSAKSWAAVVAAVDKQAGKPPAPGTVIACTCGGFCGVN